MNQETQDTRATAYVFGELSPAEAAKFEQELAASDDLRHEVAGIEEAVAAVQAELDSQTRGVSEADRARIESAMTRRPAAATASPSDPAATRRQWLVRLAIAASVVLLVGLAIPALTQMRQRELANRPENAGAHPEDAAVQPSAGFATDLAATLDRDLKETQTRESEVASPEKLVEANQRLSRRTEELVEELEELSAARQANVSGQLTELSRTNGQDEYRSSLSRASDEPRSGATIANQKGQTVADAPASKSRRMKMADGDKDSSGKPTTVPRHQIDALGIELTESLEASKKPTETRYSGLAPATTPLAQAETAPAPVASSPSPVLQSTTKALRTELAVVKSRGSAEKKPSDLGLAEISDESRRRITAPEPNALSR